MKTIDTNRLTLLIGTVVGQLSGLLNEIGNIPHSEDMRTVYVRLADIHKAAGLQLHEIYYKAKTENEDN